VPGRSGSSRHVSCLALDLSEPALELEALGAADGELVFGLLVARRERVDRRSIVVGLAEQELDRRETGVEVGSAVLEGGLERLVDRAPEAVRLALGPLAQGVSDGEPALGL
jgi:hypothetical protein